MTVIAAVRALAVSPRPQGCRKLTGSKNDWRIRVGDYRVIYEIADAIRVVRVNSVCATGARCIVKPRNQTAGNCPAADRPARHRPRLPAH